MNAKTHKELRRIMRSIPLELQRTLTVKVPKTPALQELYEKAKADPDIDPEALRKLELMKRAGMLDETEEIVDDAVAQQIDAYLEEQIQRAIKLGRLPRPEDDEDYDKYVKKHYVLPHADEVEAHPQHQEGDSPERIDDRVL